MFLFGSWCRWICKVVVERFQSGGYRFGVVSCMLSDITVFLTDGNDVFTRETLSQIGNRISPIRIHVRIPFLLLYQNM